MVRERGFTLVEVLAALTLGALVTLMAHTVFSGIVDASARAEEEWQRLHSTANAQRLIARLISNVEIGPGPADAFRGQQHELAFPAWHTDRRRKVVRRNVRVALRDGSVVVEGLDYGRVTLFRDATALNIDYLSEFGAGSAWLVGWSSTASAPPAIRVRVATASGTDTLLYLVGERG